MIQDALELLHGSETALIVYTDGHELDLDAPDGKAFTAWWRMAESRAPDKVIIYRTNSADNRSGVYIADYAGKERRPSDGRFKVYLACVEFAGETTVSWTSFVNGSKGMRSPFRYVSASLAD
jgi:hypothetical protein